MRQSIECNLANDSQAIRADLIERVASRMPRWKIEINNIDGWDTRLVESQVVCALDGGLVAHQVGDDFAVFHEGLGWILALGEEPSLDLRDSIEAPEAGGDDVEVVQLEG